MLWYAENLLSFLLKKSQIELYHDVNEVARIRGHLEKRSYHQANIHDQSEEEEMKVYEKMNTMEVQTDNSKKSHHREELRNMIIG